MYWTLVRLCEQTYWCTCGSAFFVIVDDSSLFCLRRPSVHVIAVSIAIARGESALPPLPAPSFHLPVDLNAKTTKTCQGFIAFQCRRRAAIDNARVVVGFIGFPPPPFPLGFLQYIVQVLVYNQSVENIGKNLRFPVTYTCCTSIDNNFMVRHLSKCMVYSRLATKNSRNKQLSVFKNRFHLTPPSSCCWEGALHFPFASASASQICEDICLMFSHA